MYNYIYELLQAPALEDEWTKAWEYHEHPDAFPIADIVEDAKDRIAAITRFGTWLEGNRLGKLTAEMFTVDTQAADRYFEGRFAAFQQAVSALQQLNETQFIHDHNHVERLIDELSESFIVTDSDACGHQVLQLAHLTVQFLIIENHSRRKGSAIPQSLMRGTNRRPPPVKASVACSAY